jgi:MYXO-CTERM domain-containing protein
VLSNKRVAPRGYYEIKIDEALVNWYGGGSNYFGPSGLVSQAANEAGGNAFVTEYAGPSSVAQRTVYTNGTINLTTLMMAMTPPSYVQQLISMGLANDSLMLPLLAKYIPMPDAVKAMGISDATFYGNISTYWQQYAFPPYDLAGLTQAISDSIVTPRINAQMMIDGHPYLTRLNTFISPEEMTKDPFFFEARDLTDVSNVHTAVIRTMCGNSEYMSCNAPMRLELSDGRMAWIRSGSNATTCQSKYPTTVTGLPSAEIAWAREDTGEGARVIDNTAVIASGLAAYNATYTAEQMRFPIPSGTGGSVGIAGAGGGGAGGGGTATGGAGGAVQGSGGTTGTGGSSGPGSAGNGGPGAGGSSGLGSAGVDGLGPSNGSQSGCGCATGGSGAQTGAAALAFAALFVLSLSRRRRRAR